MRFTGSVLVCVTIVVLTSVMGCASVSGGRISGVNWALAKNGGRVTAFSEEPEHPASTLNNGITSSEGWDQGEGWQAPITKAMGGRRSGDARREEMERNWVVVEFAQPVTVSNVNIYTVDSEKYPAKNFGVSELLVQYELKTSLNEMLWASVDKFGKGIGDQDNIIRENISGVINVRFNPVTTSKIRVLIYGTNDMARTEDGGRAKEGIIRLTEIEAYGTGTYKERDELETIFK